MMHHECGPSTLGRRYLCPGSRRMEQLLPDVETEWSRQGTRLHQAIAAELSGEACPIEFDPKERDLIKRCVDFARAELPDEEILVEQRLSLYNGGRHVTFGTIDAHGFEGDDGVLVLDWKPGFQEPSDEDLSFQLTAYVVMACQHWGKGHGRALAYMPRSDRVVEVDVPDPIEKQRRIVEVIDATYEVDAPLNPRDGDHCTFCKAFHHATCPAVANKVAKLAAYPHPERLELANLQECANLLPVVEPAVKKIRAKMKEQLERDPDSIKGWKLQECLGPREGDAKDIYDCASKELAMTWNEIFDHAKISVKGLSGSYKGSQENFDAMMSGITERKPQVKLVRDK